MDITLTPELERFVKEKLEGGAYHSANDVVREGLQLLRERDEIEARKLDDLRRAIAEGIEQADSGRLSPFDEETLRQVQAEGRERLAAERRSKAR